MPSGARYRDLVRQRNAAQRQLDDWVDSLTRSVRERVEAATPGAAARPVALANAAALDPPLRPIGGAPIDVMTGRPMTTSDWAVDHIMARSEIARDPRFARLTPLQQEELLLDVPENYLPLLPEINSMKGGLSVDAFIRLCRTAGRPLPPPIEAALRAADIRARFAIEARFIQLTSQ